MLWNDYSGLCWRLGFCFGFFNAIGTWIASHLFSHWVEESYNALTITVFEVFSCIISYFSLYSYIHMCRNWNTSTFLYVSNKYNVAAHFLITSGEQVSVPLTVLLLLGIQSLWELCRSGRLARVWKSLNSNRGGSAPVTPQEKARTSISLDFCDYSLS